MKTKLGSIRHLLLCAAPLVTTVSVAAPTQAATFASSMGSFLFTDFSHEPHSVLTSTDTYTLTLTDPFKGSKKTIVTAFADAQAEFWIEPRVAFNITESTAIGSDTSYFGSAQSEAQVIGHFWSDQSQPFSFNFNANLALGTAIDNPSGEGAKAKGSLAFALLDTTQQDNYKVLDFFSLAGLLKTFGDGDFVLTNKSRNVALNNECNRTESGESFNCMALLGGTQELIYANITGSYWRKFNQPTHLTLIEIKTNQATVKAPEPSSIFALLLVGSFLGVGLRGCKLSNSTSESISRN